MIMMIKIIRIKQKGPVKLILLVVRRSIKRNMAASKV